MWLEANKKPHGPIKRTDMNAPSPSLPDAWVARIFATMRATYGSAFDRAWACPAGEDPAAHGAFMRAHWARELGPLQANPDAIRHGLSCLPPLPPTLPEFRALCNGRPEPPPPPALPAPKADLARVAQIVSRVQRSGSRHPRACALALREREQAGQRLTQYQRDYWREVLGVDDSASE
jgi:hypothetical protein